METPLQHRLKQGRFESPAQEAMLNLLVAAGHLHEQMDRICAASDITSGQYNVLRILRGAHPDGYPRCEIIARMVERAPDVTRLIDRLEKRGLVERARSKEDRRLSLARITKAGMEILTKMQPEVTEVQRALSQRLSDEECRALSRLCEKLYAE